ncbi:MAG: hypothetical protein H0U10_13640 [Chloroflexia bacterium]|nr:hypothetical protein [Chloroflexia bacterium]
MEVEWLIVADAAEVVNNKLYMMGGGWDAFFVNDGWPASRRVAVAASFKVPWNQTNQRHRLDIDILDHDGNELGQLGGHFEVGQPLGVPSGHAQRVQLSADLELTFQGPGEVVIVARVEGQELRRTSIQVVLGPVLQMRQRAAG